MLANGSIQGRGGEEGRTAGVMLGHVVRGIGSGNQVQVGLGEISGRDVCVLLCLELHGDCLISCEIVLLFVCANRRKESLRHGSIRDNGGAPILLWAAMCASVMGERSSSAFTGRH